MFSTFMYLLTICMSSLRMRLSLDSPECPRQCQMSPGGHNCPQLRTATLEVSFMLLFQCLHPQNIVDFHPHLLVLRVLKHIMNGNSNCITAQSCVSYRTLKKSIYLFGCVDSQLRHTGSLWHRVRSFVVMHQFYLWHMDSRAPGLHSCSACSQRGRQTCERRASRDLPSSFPIPKWSC